MAYQKISPSEHYQTRKSNSRRALHHVPSLHRRTDRPNTRCRCLPSCLLHDGTCAPNNHHTGPIPGQTANAELLSYKNKRANITLATLNMCGLSAPSHNMNALEKWIWINYTIRINKIAILALQETHLNEEMADSIKRCFGKNFDLLYSSNPENPCTIARVVFVLNKALIPNRDPKLHVLAPSQAILLKINWPNDKPVKIMNIYASVQNHKQLVFWANVETEQHAQHLPYPNFLLEDFNITKDLINRSPPSADNQAATDILREIRLLWEIQDQ